MREALLVVAAKWLLQHLLHMAYPLPVATAQLIRYPVNTNICITFIQCRPNVFDVEPTLYKCYTSNCVYWDVS